MQLKSLELNGFKSFASKAVFEFPRNHSGGGITAIVGPNGSGKSNIIDGIRWLLGEREAKNLRGEKIENLIFNGTPKKPRVAMAQVTLNFENNLESALELGSEISVVRMVSRDGNPSQYYLNKAEIRLKDAVDFFAKIKLGTKGLAIINQGASDLFVRVTPEERKAMIEEVLGLREYQIKKSEAERKLKNTDINLEKVRAMIEEVLPRLRMLKKQTVKWEKRAQIEIELKQNEDNYFSFKIFEIEEEEKKFNENLAELEEKISVKNREFAIANQEVKNLEQKSATGNFEEIKKQKNDLLARHLRIQKELSRLEAKMEMLQMQAQVKNKLHNNDVEPARSNAELISFISEIKNFLNSILNKKPEEAVAGVKKIIKRIDSFFRHPDNQIRHPVEQIRHPEHIRFTQCKLREGSQNDARGDSSPEPALSAANVAQNDINLEHDKQNLLREISIIENDLKKIEKTEAEIADSWQNFNQKFQKAFEELEEKRKELGSLDYQKQRIIFEKEKLEMRLGDLKNQIHQAERNFDEIKSLLCHFRPVGEQASYGTGSGENPTSCHPRESGNPADFQNIDLSDAERKMFRLRAELASIGEIDLAAVKEAEDTEKHFNFLSGQISDLEKSSADLKILINDLKEKIHREFLSAFNSINEHFNKYFHLMFGGGSAKMRIKNYELRIKNNNEEVNDNNNENNEEREEKVGVEIDLNLPKKKITDLEMLSSGEKSLVSIAALFALISVSPPPFLVLDEIDAPLDEKNSKRFADLVREFSNETQFIIITHNRAVMETADVLYGITMADDGVSKVISLKLEA